MFVHDAKDTVDWGILAGYEDQKRQIEDTLLLALLHPGAFVLIAGWWAAHAPAWMGGRAAAHAVVA